MKSLRNKVIMSAIVLVFAVIATIGSTYAWFTVSDTVEVTTFNVTVESTETLLMRVWRDTEVEAEGQNYGSYNYGSGNAAWTLDDFSSSVNIHESPVYNTGGAQDIDAAFFTPVTCLSGEDSTGGDFDTAYDTVDFMNLRTLTGDAIDDFGTVGRELTTAQKNSASGGYVELKFWLLRTDTTGTNLNVALTYDVDDNSAVNDYENAVYVGVLGDTQASTIDNNQTIFSEGPDLGFSWTSSDAGFDPDGGSTINGVTNTNLLTESGLLGVSGTTSVTYLNTANQPELITVRIWVEGWDADADNAIMGATFDIDLSFSLIA